MAAIPRFHVDMFASLRSPASDLRSIEFNVGKITRAAPIGRTS